MDPKQYSLVTIPATEQRLLHAPTINQDYVISVALPYHYQEGLDKTYPVIYVLDANWYFGMVVDMVRSMNTRVTFCNELPDAIIVGIGYPNGETLTEKHSQVCQRRLRDFTPTRDEGLEVWHRSEFPIDELILSGGADHFLAFIKTQVLPLIEAHYRADASQRYLLGHSLGGLFALHTVFSDPTLFQGYVIASPAEMYEIESWFKEGATQNSAHISARLYLSTGDLELDLEPNGRSRFTQLAQLLSRLSSHTQFVEQIFPKNTHCAVVAPAFQAGLVAILS